MLQHALQKAGYDYQQTDPLGPTDLAGFLATIDEFAWDAQHAAWDENGQDGALPAVILQNPDDQRELWVTAFDDGSFQVQSVSLQPRKSLFGKPKMEQDATVTEAPDRAAMETLCRQFCGGDYAALDQEVKRLRAEERAREDD